MPTPRPEGGEPHEEDPGQGKLAIAVGINR
jgi:hypothetical protein